MKSFLTWVIYSSTNAEKISLTVKGAMVAVIPILLHFFPMLDLSVFADQIALFVQQIFAVIATGMLIWGGLRKMWTTLAGTNKVLQ